MNIKDYEDYLIFEDGGVLSIKTNKFLKPGKTPNGYLFVHLYKNGKSKPFKIHRLVGLHYIPNSYNKPFIDHIDRDKTNNDISNLRWATRSENQINRTYNKNKKLKEKNICKNKGGYNITIGRNNLIYTKRKKTLDEAKIQRDLMISMWI